MRTIDEDVEYDFDANNIVEVIDQIPVKDGELFRQTFNKELEKQIKETRSNNLTHSITPEKSIQVKTASQVVTDTIF